MEPLPHDDLPIILAASYPPVEESPNWCGHWRQKHRAKRSYKFAQQILLGPQVSTQRRTWVADTPAIEVVLRMSPPMPKRGGAARPRDRDNALGRCKTLLDVVADLLGTNDSKFRPRVVFDDPVGDGSVLVTLKPDRSMID